MIQGTSTQLFDVKEQIKKKLVQITYFLQLSDHFLDIFKNERHISDS